MWLSFVMSTIKVLGPLGHCLHFMWHLGRQKPIWDDAEKIQLFYIQKQNCHQGGEKCKVNLLCLDQLIQHCVSMLMDLVSLKHIWFNDFICNFITRHWPPTALLTEQAAFGALWSAQPLFSTLCNCSYFFLNNHAQKWLLVKELIT